MDGQGLLVRTNIDSNQGVVDKSADMSLADCETSTVDSSQPTCASLELCWPLSQCVTGAWCQGDENYWKCYLVVQSRDIEW